MVEPQRCRPAMLAALLLAAGPLAPPAAAYLQEQPEVVQGQGYSGYDTFVGQVVASTTSISVDSSAGSSMVGVSPAGVADATDVSMGSNAGSSLVNEMPKGTVATSRTSASSSAGSLQAYSPAEASTVNSPGGAVGATSFPSHSPETLLVHEPPDGVADATGISTDSSAGSVPAQLPPEGAAGAAGVSSDSSAESLLVHEPPDSVADSTGVSADSNAGSSSVQDSPEGTADATDVSNGSAALVPEDSVWSAGCDGQVARNVNCWGEDVLFTSVAVKSFEECCAQCAGNPACNAWTVDSRSVVDEPDTEGRCWLKSSCAGRKSDPHAISGIMNVATSSSATLTGSLTASFTSTTASSSGMTNTATGTSAATATELAATTSTTTSSTSHETTTAALFDCREGALNWKAGWSESKKDWCCAFQPPLGCSFRADAALSEPYHCMSGHGSWESSWSEAKKKWCCQFWPPLGCSNSTVNPFDCTAGRGSWKASWSEAKKAWCCQSIPPLGCPADEPRHSAAFDCAETYFNWETEWSEAKKSWCCEHHFVDGCPAPNTSSIVVTTTATLTKTQSATSPPSTSSTSTSAVSTYIVARATTTVTLTSSTETTGAVSSSFTTSSVEVATHEFTTTSAELVTTSAELETTSAELETTSAELETTSAHEFTTRSAEDCFFHDEAYEPLDIQGFSIEEDVLSCQSRCASTDGCHHFSFWSVGGHCHLEDESATRMNPRPGFISGPERCCNATSCSNGSMHGSGTFLPREMRCMHRGVEWTPELPGQSRVLTDGEFPSKEDAVLGCQQACSMNGECVHFSITFPSRMCTLSGDQATSSQLLGTISGPPSCDDDEAEACTDTDNGTTDLDGDNCFDYSEDPRFCKSRDDSDFSSAVMCCACGGGTEGSPSDGGAHTAPPAVGLFSILVGIRSWFAGPESTIGAVVVGCFAVGGTFWVLRARRARAHARSAVTVRYALLRSDEYTYDVYDETPHRWAQA